MSGLDREARSASRGAEPILSQLRRVRDRLLSPHISAARLFFADDGKFRPGATEWLERLAKDNFVRASTQVPGDREQSLINEGRRQVVLEILDSVSLDGERLDEINAQIREIEHGRG